jgi:hypothetical protein
MLGGGSLAAGGFGMAGGAWLVTAAGAAVGVAAGGATGGGSSSVGSAREIQLVLHPQAFRLELAKLLVSLKEIMVAFEIPQAASISGLLGLRRNELESFLEEQVLVNDEDSERIKSLKEKIDMLQRAVTWVKKQENSSAQGA